MSADPHDELHFPDHLPAMKAFVGEAMLVRRSGDAVSFIIELPTPLEVEPGLTVSAITIDISAVAARKLTAKILDIADTIEGV